MKKPTSILHVKSRRKPIHNENKHLEENMTKSEKVALWVTDKVGTTGFFMIVFCWTVTWLSWNVFAPNTLQFDPFPAFVLWLFLSNLIQIFLMPLIMIGQNQQAKRAYVRADNQLELNIKAEKEIEVILEHLEYQNSLILEILKKIEKKS